MAATQDQMMSAIDKLVNSDGSVSLPGLNLNSVAQNYVDKKYATQLDACETSTERSELRQSLIKYYTEGEGKTGMQLEISSIKSNFSAAKDQLGYVQTAATSSIASNAIPSVLTVGTATSTANPAYVLIENKTKKNQLQAMLKNIGACLVNLLKSAVSLNYEVPSSVTTLVNTLATVKSAVNSIPV